MQDIKINKEISNYKEKLVLNYFDIKQTICVTVGIVLALITYRMVPFRNSTVKLLIAMIPVIPCGIIGFFEYNKMPGNEFLKCLYEYYIKNPKKYPSVPVNQYWGKTEDFGKKLRDLENLKKEQEKKNAKNTK